jgi:hypothetical protein
MEEEPNRIGRRLWLGVAAVAVLAFCAWGYFGTGLSVVIACRASGGTPTNAPTTVTVASEREVRHIPIVVPTCLR